MATSTEIRKNINDITSKPTTNDSSYKLSQLHQDLKIANKQEVFDYLIEKDLPYNAVLGLMGNIDHETGGSFDYTQQQYNDGPGYGLWQMEGLKKQAYDLYTERRPDSMEAQVDFMVDSVYNPNNLPDSVLSLMKSDRTKADIVGPGNARDLQEVFANGSVEDVTTAFMNMWEMPKDYLLHKENPNNQTYYENYQENLGQRIADANTAKGSFPPPTEFKGEGLGKVAMGNVNDGKVLPMKTMDDDTVPTLAKSTQPEFSGNPWDINYQYWAKQFGENIPAILDKEKRISTTRFAINNDMEQAVADEAATFIQDDQGKYHMVAAIDLDGSITGEIAGKLTEEQVQEQANKAITSGQFRGYDTEEEARDAGLYTLDFIMKNYRPKATKKRGFVRPEFSYQPGGYQRLLDS
tara:strand:+ start:465 stop:1688 length:1224 start_codon:yes stop_codon:yes gene_type:complete